MPGPSKPAGDRNKACAKHQQVSGGRAKRRCRGTDKLISGIKRGRNVVDVICVEGGVYAKSSQLPQASGELNGEGPDPTGELCNRTWSIFCCFIRCGCTNHSPCGNKVFGRGDWVEVGLGSGNRDEASWADADVFRLDRENPRDHVAFGAASHVCPGAALARHEGEAAVRALLDRVAAMEPVEDTDYPHLPSSLSDRSILARLIPRT